MGPIAQPSNGYYHHRSSYDYLDPSLQSQMHRWHGGNAQGPSPFRSFTSRAHLLARCHRRALKGASRRSVKDTKNNARLRVSVTSSKFLDKTGMLPSVDVL